MSVPGEVQAMHLRLFERYVSLLLDRLGEINILAKTFEEITDEAFITTAASDEALALCGRIERLLSIGTEFYESREEPSVVETTPIISPVVEQPALEESRSPAFEDRNRCPERDKDGNRCLHDAGHRGTHLAAWGLSAGWATATSEEPEEEPVKATPTMSAEAMRAWEAAQTTPQPERKRPVWSQEARDAAAERARNRNKKIAHEEAPALASTAPSLPEQAPTPRDDSPAGDLTPEEAAHEDAAIILAELEPDPLPTRETISIGNRPDCACPDGWLKPGESWMAADRALTHRHHVDCPLHRHKHRFGVAPDGDGNLVGRCECGDTEYRPVEPERAKVDNRAKAVAS